ncbi:uncharacterized protein LOC114527775 [Dendronephthya gigantea]|uniref:uncharacterized protein LOC114527775 n=1 Tax=Dendronephthya gigantea TaxID=151771 RepID=UPI00106A166D|nr:uncharacterized protein LOC114527775 [Dendronephthya gigantea]
MSKPMDFWENHDCRSLKDIQDCAVKNRFSCQHKPLLEVKLENVVLDELHLMLRITDILTKSLVNEALEWDFKDNSNKPPKDRTSKHLSDLVECIQSCGVSFNVWEKRNADGKGSGVHDFTSLMGSDKKRLMRDLPDKLCTVTKPAHRL